MKLTCSIKNILLIVLLVTSSSLAALELTDAELMGSDGEKHHLKDYLGHGKWLTILVWGPKCPACIEEIPGIQRLYDDRQKTNIEVLGLAIDFPTFSYAKIKQVQKFEEDYFITFPNLLISSSLFKGLDIGALQGTPTVILVDPMGKVSAVQLGGVPEDAIKKYVIEQNESFKKVATESNNL